jgi:hypothetical protein
MALNREERKLIHQKSKQPTFGNGKPDTGSGNEGDIAFRKVHGSGTVQYLKQDGDWIPLSSSGQLRSPVTQSTLTDHSSLIGLGSDDHEQYLLISGSRAMSGNLSLGGNDIGSVGALDVDGHTTLDQVTVNTTDGAFAVSGANPISLTTTGSNDINLTSGNTLDVSAGVDYELDVVRTCDWNTTITDWDNSDTFDLTSVGNVKIETSGANTEKTISIFNTNNPSASFDGVHIKADSQDALNCQNRILIEATSRASKGGNDGVKISSEDGIVIGAIDAHNNDKSNIVMRATANIDMGGGASSISIIVNQPYRVILHSPIEVLSLYKSDPNVAILTDNGQIAGDSTTANGNHTKFQAIDTTHLVRAQTYKASASVARLNSHPIVSAADDDNIAGTCWLVTVTWKHDSDDVNSQLWMCTAVGTADDELLAVLIKENLESTHGTASATLTWTSSSGIVWTNSHSAATGSTATMKASALRMQSGNDF